MLAVQSIGVGQDLLKRLAEARNETDKLFELVRPGSLYERPIPERHRIIFYIGHLEAFEWNLFHGRLFDLKSFHPEFDRLFAFGIDPVGGGLPSDQPSDWPALTQVHDYVSQVRSALDAMLTKLDLSSSDAEDGPGSSSPRILLNVAIEHRLMHAETLAYMLHQMPLEQKIAAPAATPGHLEHSLKPTLKSSLLKSHFLKPKMIRIPAGPATLGLARDDSSAFGWDNEYIAHTLHVPEFEIDEHKVSNGQYLEFIEAGGYETQDYWTEADWNWKTENHISHPIFWKRTDGAWYYRTMFHEVALPLDWPVYVSHAEASAYARWAGKALPTEAQWHRAAYATGEGAERPYPWGNEAPDPRLGNFDFNSWDPAPVGAYAENRSAFGVAGLLGNGWEWTSTIFAPLPGFQPFSFYPGYSANFFDGEHYVLKGGSARTAACMLRRSFRNWFQPHYQYLYAGFRCVNEE